LPLTSKLKSLIDVKAGGDNAPTAFINVCLLTETELIDYSTVSVDVLLLEISEKVTSVTYHLEKTSSGVVVVLVGLEVSGKIVDSSCKDSDLDLRRSCVIFVGSVSLDNGCLFIFQ
jgi:repressor of nif and glnA expression